MKRQVILTTENDCLRIEIFDMGWDSDGNSTHEQVGRTLSGDNWDHILKLASETLMPLQEAGVAIKRNALAEMKSSLD